MVVRGGTAVKAIVGADLRATYSTLLSSQLVSDLFLFECSLEDVDVGIVFKIHVV